jgi:hypothetical protein
MGFKKVKDLAVVTGQYEKSGETKKRYENVGSVMKGDDGNSFILLKRSFNPAGVPFKEGGDQIIIGIFDLKESDGQAPVQQQAPTAVQTDEIPF